MQDRLVSVESISNHFAHAQEKRHHRNGMAHISPLENQLVDFI